MDGDSRKVRTAAIQSPTAPVYPGNLLTPSRPSPVSTKPEPAPRITDATTQSLAADVVRVASGDQAAFARVYDATSRWVYGLALRILSDAEAAEDICLDVYQRAWQRAAAFDPDRGSVTSWLMAMTRNRAIDRLRSRLATARREIAIDDEVLARMDPRPLPDIQAHLADQSVAIRRALQSLRPEQREVIELAFFEGLSHGKIAQRLDQPLGTVKTRIRNGIRDLASLLQSLEAQQ